VNRIFRLGGAHPLPHPQNSVSGGRLRSVMLIPIVLVSFTVSMTMATTAGAATSFCLTPTGQFSSCPGGATTIQPDVTAPTEPNSGPSASSQSELPFSAPVPASHPAIINNSGISVSPDLRPVLIGVGILAIDALLSVGIISTRRRWLLRRRSLIPTATNPTGAGSNGDRP
jgi:hypothetical protein